MAGWAMAVGRGPGPEFSGWLWTVGPPCELRVARASRGWWRGATGSGPLLSQMPAVAAEARAVSRVPCSLLTRCGAGRTVS